jgi:hypothetical protein
MHLKSFLLDQWLAQKQAPNSNIEYDLASSTGPVWTLRELLALAPDESECERLLDARLFYTSPQEARNCVKHWPRLSKSTRQWCKS